MEIVDTHCHASPIWYEPIEALAEQGACGVRLCPDTRSPDRHGAAIWEKASELNLPVSCGGKKEDFLNNWFLEIVERFHGLPIILEHLGSANHPDGEEAFQAVMM